MSFGWKSTKIIIVIVCSFVIVGSLFVYYRRHTNQKTTLFDSLFSSRIFLPATQSPVLVGGVVAGTQSPLYEFSPQAFHDAQQQNKKILLYFYAGWCSICREEFGKHVVAFFNESTDPNLVGFRVNYNDWDTDTAEQSIIAEMGVKQQHTKIIFQGTTELLRDDLPWSVDIYTKNLTPNTSVSVLQ